MSADFIAFRDQFNTIIREFTESLKEIADDLNKPKALEPGQAIDADTARGLPVGSSFRDAESDVWYVTEQGFSWYASGRDTTDLDPARYEPLTLVSLPEPEADLAEDEDDEDDTQDGEAPEAKMADWEKELLGVKPYHVQIGDLVRMTEGVNSYQGQVGTVGKLKTIETNLLERVSRTGARYTVEGSFWYAGDVEKVVTPDEEASPATPAIGDRVKVVRTKYAITAYRQGEEGTVVGTEEGVPWVRFDDGGKVLAAETEPVPAPAPVPAPEPEADPDLSVFKVIDRDGDVLEVAYLGYNNVVKVHTNRGGKRDFSSVYLSASELDDLIARLQGFKQAYENAGDRFPF